MDTFGILKRALAGHVKPLHYALRQRGWCISTQQIYLWMAPQHHIAAKRDPLRRYLEFTDELREVYPEGEALLFNFICAHRASKMRADRADVDKGILLARLIKEQSDVLQAEAVNAPLTVVEKEADELVVWAQNYCAGVKVIRERELEVAA